MKPSGKPTFSHDERKGAVRQGLTKVLYRTDTTESSDSGSDSMWKVKGPGGKFLHDKEDSSDGDDRVRNMLSKSSVPLPSFGARSSDNVYSGYAKTKPEEPKGKQVAELIDSDHEQEEEEEEEEETPAVDIVDYGRKPLRNPMRRSSISRKFFNNLRSLCSTDEYRHASSGDSDTDLLKRKTLSIPTSESQTGMSPPSPRMEMRAHTGHELTVVAGKAASSSSVYQKKDLHFEGKKGVQKRQTLLLTHLQDRLRVQEEFRHSPAFEDVASPSISPRDSVAGDLNLTPLSLNTEGSIASPKRVSFASLGSLNSNGKETATASVGSPASSVATPRRSLSNPASLASPTPETRRQKPSTASKKPSSASKSSSGAVENGTAPPEANAKPSTKTKAANEPTKKTKKKGKRRKYRDRYRPPLVYGDDSTGLWGVEAEGSNYTLTDYSISTPTKELMSPSSSTKSATSTTPRHIPEYTHRRFAPDSVKTTTPDVPAAAPIATTATAESERVTTAELRRRVTTRPKKSITEEFRDLVETRRKLRERDDDPVADVDDAHRREHSHQRDVENVAEDVPHPVAAEFVRSPRVPDASPLLLRTPREAGTRLNPFHAALALQSGTTRPRNEMDDFLHSPRQSDVDSQSPRGFPTSVPPVHHIHTTPVGSDVPSAEPFSPLSPRDCDLRSGISTTSTTSWIHGSTFQPAYESPYARLSNQLRQSLPQLPTLNSQDSLLGSHDHLSLQLSPLAQQQHSPAAYFAFSPRSTVAESARDSEGTGRRLSLPLSRSTLNEDTSRSARSFVPDAEDFVMSFFGDEGERWVRYSARLCREADGFTQKLRGYDRETGYHVPLHIREAETEVSSPRNADIGDPSMTGTLLDPRTALDRRQELEQLLKSLDSAFTMWRHLFAKFDKRFRDIFGRHPSSAVKRHMTPEWCRAADAVAKKRSALKLLDSAWRRQRQHRRDAVRDSVVELRQQIRQQFREAMPYG